MGKWILGGALIGWAAIIAFAYRLAEARIAMCFYRPDCIRPLAADRDNLLIAGLIVGLLGLIGLALLIARSPRRLSRPVATKWAGPSAPQLRQD